MPLYYSMRLYYIITCSVLRAVTLDINIQRPANGEQVYKFGVSSVCHCLTDKLTVIRRENRQALQSKGGTCFVVGLRFADYLHADAQTDITMHLFGAIQRQ